MTLRIATIDDYPELHRIRMAVRENVLSDPSRITREDYRVMIEERGRGWVAEEGGQIAGFAIGDHAARNIWALFVDPAFEGRGHGRALHDAMMAWMFERSRNTVWLSTEPGTRAEAFYRAAGWRDAGMTAHGERRFELDPPGRR